MNGFTMFDRHTYMSPETRRDIMNILNKTCTSLTNDRHLSNMLYGLFDGYLYDDIVSESSRIGIDESVIKEIENVVDVVSAYPKLPASDWD